MYCLIDSFISQKTEDAVGGTGGALPLGSKKELAKGEEEMGMGKVAKSW